MEKREVKLDDEIVEYILEYKKIKNAYIKINKGKIIITANKKFKIKDIEKILLEKKKWILTNINKKSNVINLKENELLLFGKIYIIKVNDNIDKKDNNINIHNLDKVIEISNKFLSKYKYKVKLEDEIYKICCDKLILNKINELADKTKLYPKKIKFKKYKSVWGKCDSKGDITLNTRLCLFNIKAIEYVIIHELCHLKHHNHSKLFWNEVLKYETDYKEIKKYMKEYINLYNL